MEIYNTRRISDSLTLVCEQLGPMATFVMGLVVGKDKAVIVDSGMGVLGDLDVFLNTLTDKPLSCIVTHAHPDHVGGAPLFETVYMSDLDDPLVPWSLSVESRLGDLAGMSGGNEELLRLATERITRAEGLSHLPLKDGDEFDLGGVVLRTIATPGHTKGSVCLVNDKEGYVLVSDSINPFPWLWLKDCAPIAAWRDSLVKLQGSCAGMKLYCGHSMQELPQGIVEDLICGADEILAGKTEKDVPFTMPFGNMTGVEEYARIHPCKLANIVYNIDNIR